MAFVLRLWRLTYQGFAISRNADNRNTLQVDILNNLSFYSTINSVRIINRIQHIEETAIMPYEYAKKHKKEII